MSLLSSSAQVHAFILIGLLELCHIRIIGLPLQAQHPGAASPHDIMVIQTGPSQLHLRPLCVGRVVMRTGVDHNCTAFVNKRG